MVFKKLTFRDRKKAEHQTPLAFGHAPKASEGSCSSPKSGSIENGISMNPQDWFVIGHFHSSTMVISTVDPWFPGFPPKNRKKSGETLPLRSTVLGLSPLQGIPQGATEHHLTHPSG